MNAGKRGLKRIKHEELTAKITHLPIYHHAGELVVESYADIVVEHAKPTDRRKLFDNA